MSEVPLYLDRSHHLLWDASSLSILGRWRLDTHSIKVSNVFRKGAYGRHSAWLLKHLSGREPGRASISSTGVLRSIEKALPPRTTI